MKTALMPALLTFGGIGLWAAAPAVAQYGTPAPVSTKPTFFLSVDTVSAQGQSDSQAPIATAPMPAGGTAATSAPTGVQSPYPTTQGSANGTAASGVVDSPATANSPLVDNGLWEGAIGRSLLLAMRRRQCVPARLVYPPGSPRPEPQRTEEYCSLLPSPSRGHFRIRGGSDGSHRGLSRGQQRAAALRAHIGGGDQRGRGKFHHQPNARFPIRPLRRRS